MPSTRRPELLAPAGDRESLVAAVENGCDAVYLGAQILSARASAANFTPDELADAIDYAHLRGVKAYVTVNTLVKDSETGDAADLLYHLDKSGVDSVIVQDMGLLSLARSVVPWLPVHASTQMTVHNSEGVRFLQAMGVKRVVLAREMTLEEIRLVRRNAGIEIETFVHGALCISYSGQCLTSSMIGGRSGNRGFCAQPCRKRYELRTAGRRVETDGEYLLSPKDLNASRVLPELIDAGVDSLKIEGRLKRPEYVACAVWIYRRLIDRYVEDPSEYFVSDDESLRLAQLFNRGFTEAYLGKNPRGTLMSRIRPHNRGIRVGTVIRHDQRTGRISVELLGGLNIGDGIGIEEVVKTVRNAGDPGNIGHVGAAGVGMIVRQMYAGGRRIDRAGAGTIVEIPSGVSAHVGSAVYRTLDRQLMDSLRRTFTSPAPLRKVPVMIRAKAAVGFPFELQIGDRDSNRVCVHSEYVIERAVRDPTTEGQIVRQLTKLGKTVFEVSDIGIEIEGDVFIPVSQLNLVRNDAVSRLESARIGRVRRGHAIPIPALSPAPVASHANTTEPPAPMHKAGGPVNTLLAVSTNTLAGVKSAISGGADAIYLGGERYREEVRTGGGLPDLEAAVKYAHREGRRIYINTPRIVKDSGMGSVAEMLSRAKTLGFDGALASNHGVFRLAMEIGLEVIADMPLNTFNRRSLGFWVEHGAKMAVLSPELTLAEIQRIAPHGAVECIVHGRLTLMESEHCVVGGILGGTGEVGDGGEGGKCTAPCEVGCFELVDEKGYVFPLRMDTDCRTHLMNSKELCMVDHVSGIVEAGVSSIRIDVIGIDDDRVRAITRLYRSAVDGGFDGRGKVRTRCRDITDGYTTGHYKRGVL
uniref:Peptidase U32 collagenase domain-containing protein n=1 Tax=Candidatus Methanogaster sp. ANME-2c ERB4 TaxID=2759911 RepID=A0A7G9Y716_9EURY|nr:hypothetical protein BPLLOOKG_00026 [Methanosarcinales archaeon ANME-2c ERB4]QNO50608.1 hypothetical protein EGELPFMD_00028 [Methanosarcinales archaeon ANME-2c ERB4]